MNMQGSLCIATESSAESTMRSILRMYMRSRYLRGVLVASIVGLLALPSLSKAATLTPDVTTYQKAQVTEIVSATRANIPGTNTEASTQKIAVRLLDGPGQGSTVTFDNDYIQLGVGDIFYLRHQTNNLDGTDYYSVADPYRLNIIFGLTGLFLILVLLFGGRQGLRGLASLCGSLILILYVLLPGILHGYPPVWMAVGVSSLIIIVGSYITHGFNRTTSAAVLGMIATVLVTGALGYWAVHAAHLSGYNSDESTYLTFNTNGQIDLVGLLFGGIMIGLLGVLYDIAIGQAVAIEELFRAGAHLSRLQIYQRGIRIGREHIGALINTLAIAYVGASLPLLLLLYTNTVGWQFTINSEIIATEIIRILIGSIGLILGVPTTTLIASYMLSAHMKPSQTGDHSHHH
jgi:uncharacterized membrane protein